MSRVQRVCLLHTHCTARITPMHPCVNSKGQAAQPCCSRHVNVEGERGQSWVPWRPQMLLSACASSKYPIYAVLVGYFELAHADSSICWRNSCHTPPAGASLLVHHYWKCKGARQDACAASFTHVYANVHMDAPALLCPISQTSVTVRPAAPHCGT